MNEVATQQPPQLQQVTQQQAEAWVSLARAKNEITFTLQNKELAAQGILLPVQNSDQYKEIDAALAEYRKAYSGIVNERKSFTSLIDQNIIQSLMEYEKRVDPKTNSPYNSLAQKSLALRKKETEETQKANAINQEAARFKLHVENEFRRIEGAYRSALMVNIQQAYETWLKEGQKTPDLEMLRGILAKVKVGGMNKFQPTYLSGQQMTAIYNQADKINFSDTLEAVDFLMKVKFENWESDLANAEAAIKHQQEEEALRKQAEEKKLAEEAAINTLITTAETVIVEAPKIKKTLKVTVVESEEWAKAVISEFLVNLSELRKYIRVKSWSNLKIGQMADCLGQLATDTGEKFNSLINLEEVEK